MNALRLPVSRNRVALGIKAGTVILATIAIYFQDLTIIFNDALQSETTSHILALPFIAIYLLYRKRKMLRAAIPFETLNQIKQTKHLPTIVGILLCLTAILFYWYGSYTFTPLEHHMLVLPIFVAGIILVMFNPQTLRQIAFPVAFLIFLMPPPAEIVYALGATLSVVSSEASFVIIKTLGIPSTLTAEYGNPTIIITRADGTTSSFAVDIACSGIYSLIGFLIFATFIAYLMRAKPWKKIIMFFIGLPLIYLLNITRITVILLIGYQYGEQLALQIFHLLGGWVLIFLGTLLLLSVMEKIMKTQMFTRLPASEKCSQCNQKPTNPQQNFCRACGRLLSYMEVKLKKRDIAKIATLTIAVLLLLSIQAPVFALTKGPAEIILRTPAGEQVISEILPETHGYTLKFIYRDKTFEQIAKQDASLTYAYIPEGNSTRHTISVTIEVASTRSSIHRWEACLISWPLTQGYQPAVAQLELRDVQILQNPPMIARYFAFQHIKSNLTVSILYWFETSTFNMNGTAQQKHVKVSLIAYPDSFEDMPKVENLLTTLATAIVSYWQPIKTWTQITMFISKNGNRLATIPIATLISVLIFSAEKKRKEKKGNTNSYQKLSKQDKQIIEAVYETQKKTPRNLSNIATTYTKIAQRSFTTEELFERLNQATQAGLIKKEIINLNDEPVLAWKSQVQLSRPTVMKNFYRRFLSVFHISLKATNTQYQNSTER